MPNYLKKFRRNARNLPFIEEFTDLYFPVLATLLFSMIAFTVLRYASESLGLNIFVELLFTLILGLGFGLIIFYIQQQFFHAVFTPALYEFISITKHKHPVTQIFASIMLKRCLTTGTHTFFQIFDKEQTSLLALAYNLEDPSKGVKMDKSNYSLLLTKSIEFLPLEVKAIWDTEKVPLTDKPESYHTYFEELDKAYRLISKKDNKRRIFIFQSAIECDNRNQKIMWPELMNRHKMWGFDKIHYCTKEQLNSIRTNLPDKNELIDDFVYFKCGTDFEWLISRDNPTEKVYLHKDNTTINFIYTFYNSVIHFCEEREQYIML